jgi:uncharacterized protein (DUF433 family)
VWAWLYDLGYAPAMGAPATFGRGVYGHAEAARIVSLRPRRVHRWLAGYDWTATDGSTRRSGPMLETHHVARVSFAELVELLFVSGFVKAGVPTRIVRRVHEEAAEEFQTPYPFTLKRFEHDGRSIIERVHVDGVEYLIDRYRAQRLVEAVMLPLVRRLAYDKLTKEARRFYPMGVDRPIVLDPRRSFGEASTVSRAVPTRVLAAAVAGGQTEQGAARWYGVTVEEAAAAVEYERDLDERKAA